MEHEVVINLNNYQSILQAEKMFGKMAREIEDALDDALEETGIKMVDKARTTLDSYAPFPYGTGELRESIMLETGGTDIRLVASAPHAEYVEYGTGIEGANSPHPKPEGWQYDINDHGEAGWIYKGKDGKRHWTAGTESRPFMYTAWLYGTRIVGSQVNKHINRLIRSAGGK